MKIHPAFHRLIGSMLDSGPSGQHQAYEEFQKAGCPVVEEESDPFDAHDDKICKDYWDREIDKKDHDLAAANEKIKEVEDCNLSQAEQIGVMMKREDEKDARIKELEAMSPFEISGGLAVGTDTFYNGAWNEALETAAKEFEMPYHTNRLTHIGSEIATIIRRLKREVR